MIILATSTISTNIIYPTIAVIGIFKDPRQLEKYSCCNQIEAFDLGGISNEVKKRLTEKKLRYYRQFQAPILPNDQTPR